MKVMNWVGLGLCFILVACAGKTPPQDLTQQPVQQGGIADLQKFPQDLSYYAQEAGTSKPLISAQDALARNARFDKLFFSPWGQVKTSVKAKSAFEPLRAKAYGYAANLLPWTQEHWDKVRENANASTFPSLARKAITVRPALLRDMPTGHPRFDNPKKAGEGYPFDLAQLSTLPVGMPVFVAHISKDKAWLFVETSLLSGWVATKDLAWVDDVTQQAYTIGNYAVIIQDDVSLCDQSGNFLSQAHLGTILPLTQSKPLTVLVPVRDVNGSARLVPAVLNAQQAAVKPLPVTAENIARLGNALMGRYYGWGGLNADRDCSLTMRDIFAAVGIWLPRNSIVQVKAWDYKPFDVMSVTAKEAYILAEAKPFATLLWLPGHIALYIGKVDGKAAMFHTMWGIRTMQDGKEGRHIIGRTVVTSVQPGIELPNVQDKNGLLARMSAMSILQ